MNYYEDMTPMVAEAIRLDDYRFLDALLESILPLSSERNKEYIAEIMADSAFKNSSDSMEAVIMKHFPMDPERSSGYILSRVIDKSLSRKNLGTAISNLGDYYGISVIQAIYSGDVDIAREIAKAFNWQKIRVDSVGSLGSTVIIDGDKRYNVNGINQPKITREELAELVNIASELGITELNNPGYSFFEKYLFNGHHFYEMDEMNVTPCEDLPILSGSRVLRPELLIAFDQIRGQSKAMEQIYSRIPVLVREADIGRYETVRPFRKMHKILEKINQEPTENNQRRRNYFLSEISLDEFSKKVSSISDDKREDIFQTIDQYAFTVVANDAEIRQDNNGSIYTGTRVGGEKIVDFVESSSIMKDELVISLLATEVYKTGFNDDGYVLCVIDFNELASFDLSQPNELSLRMAETSAAEFFCPTSVSQLIYPDYHAYSLYSTYDNPQKVGIRADSRYGSELINYALTGDDHKRIVNNMIGKNVALSLCSVNNPRLDPEHHIFIQSEYGITSSEIMKIKSREQVNQLHEAGYKFADNTQLAFDTRYQMRVDDMIKILEMGAWPSRDEDEPKSTIDALKTHVRRPNCPEIRAYLLHKGVDEVIMATKTEKQWERLVELFPNDGEKIVKTAPRKIKRDIVTSDLDI